MQKLNFGCGLSVDGTWVNYDGSPTLRLQRIRFLPLRHVIKPYFPDVVQYGDIVKGLPEKDDSFDAVYCSHVLEHLSHEDFVIALNEVMRVLKPGGVFRGVLPDLEYSVGRYIVDKSDSACSSFMSSTGLGTKKRSHGLVGLLRSYIGNSNHLWYWDYKGLKSGLEETGFINVRRAFFGDSHFTVFSEVENFDRWVNCLGFECFKSNT